MPKKGKKKTKAQLEGELNNAALDQRRREEKDRLYKLEQDFLSRQRERLEAERDSRERVLEAERLEEESEIVTRMKGQRRKDLEYEQQKLREKSEWLKFIACASRPNVAYESEITTYVTMAREDRAPRTRMEDTVGKCFESEEIVGDLLECWCKAKEEGDVAREEWCMHYIHQIRALEVEQIDDATAYMLQYIEKQDANAHSQVTLTWGNQNDNIKVGFWGHLQNKGFRSKQLDLPKIQIGLDLPKSIALQAMGNCIGVRVLYTTWDSCEGKDASRMSVGGMIRVDLLAIPPFSKTVKTWTIRQIPTPGQELMRLPYPNTDHTSAAASIQVQPCKIDYKVPATAVIQKNPTVSLWDPATEKWTSDGITEIVFEQETRKISFYSARLAAFSITQDRHLDLPYAHWCMRPVGPRLVELSIQASRFELSFVISEDGLRLKGPDLPELHSLIYETDRSKLKDLGMTGTSLGSRTPRVRSPATLLHELRQCGINLMPEDADAEYLDGYTPKAPETEARGYSDLSEIAGIYDIASSVHNKVLPKEKALVRVRVNTEYETFDPLDPDCDMDYQSIMFYPDKACLVKSLDRKVPCDESPLNGHVTHASLYLCYERHPNPGANHADLLQRIEVNCGNVRFVESARQTMQLLKLLSFV